MKPRPSHFLCVVLRTTGGVLALVFLLVLLLSDPPGSTRISTVELSSQGGEQVDPEVSVARKEFQRSMEEENEAKKELEEAEEDVPGWMSQFPASVLKLAVDHVQRAVMPFALNQERRAYPHKQKQAEHWRSMRGRERRRKVPSSAAAIKSSTLLLAAAKKHSEAQAALQQDPMLRTLSLQYAAALAEAEALRRKAALQMARAKSGDGKVCGLTSCVDESKDLAPNDSTVQHVGGTLMSGADSALSKEEEDLLGRLFEKNTVLHKVSTEKQALKEQFKKQVGEATRNIAATAQKIVSKVSKGEEALTTLRKKDLAVLEGRSAMSEAARQLLHVLHGSKDPWLVNTLQKISEDAEKVKRAQREIESVNSNDDPCSHEIKGLPHCATHTWQEKQRQQAEAHRLLEHELAMDQTASSHKDQKGHHQYNSLSSPLKSQVKQGVQSAGSREVGQTQHHVLAPSAPAKEGHTKSSPSQVQAPNNPLVELGRDMIQDVKDLF